MQENSALRAAARSQLYGTWLTAVGIVFIYGVLVSVASGLLGIGLLIVGGPLALGYYGYFLHKARGETVLFGNLFDGFDNFGKAFLLFLFEGIFIILWSLLFFIPGIIKSFSYSMAFFILKDNPNMNALDAITASRKMMNGYKGKLFCLHLSFIGWYLLCVLTFGIGYLWLSPYVTLSVSNFYEDLKKNQTAAQ
ncbi:MAG: DUF975 family protein [Treponema sp.]|jgi:uncharacterized membrane protein|nr:DUF975 family protein [Treponema sp.]